MVNDFRLNAINCLWHNWLSICAVNDEEAYQIKDAISKLQSALAYRGYAPR
ncbi:DUF7706 family protein [Photorhabdus temperata]|uniref:DUF7706 family protein n=1 Tax=Photorhabdus temperata TaxID=574560 RepID=UPI0003FE055D